MKNARAKRAKILFFIVKYANLWGFCCHRRRGCLSPFQKRAGEWVEFRPATASGIGTRDRVSCLQKKRSEFELFTQIFFYILLKCQSITAVCLDSPTAIEISLLDLSFIACQRT